LQAATIRGLTQFVGRDAELDELRRTQRLVDIGSGQLVAIIGEAGIGKSRLVYEFTHANRLLGLLGWRVFESTSISHGRATSYLPVIALLKSYFGIQDRDELHEIRQRVIEKTLTLDEKLESTLPALLALLDIPVDDQSWQTLDPVQRRRCNIDAVKGLLLREARKQPVLLIFEDLHWVDGESQELLDSLVSSLGSARLMLLVSFRPDYQHNWGSKENYHQIRLSALPTRDTAYLLKTGTPRISFQYRIQLRTCSGVRTGSAPSEPAPPRARHQSGPRPRNSRKILVTCLRSVTWQLAGASTPLLRKNAMRRYLSRQSSSTDARGRNRYSPTCLRTRDRLSGSESRVGTIRSRRSVSTIHRSAWPHSGWPAGGTT
jgi:AAA ATPase domain